ncbi:MAG: hypothetical protein ACFWTS_00135 [Pseudoclavibacter caeni]|jgi:hypothetical protein
MRPILPRASGRLRHVVPVPGTGLPATGRVSGRVGCAAILRLETRRARCCGVCDEGFWIPDVAWSTLPGFVSDTLSFHE